MGLVYLPVPSLVWRQLLYTGPVHHPLPVAGSSFSVRLAEYVFFGVCVEWCTVASGGSGRLHTCNRPLQVLHFIVLNHARRCMLFRQCVCPGLIPICGFFLCSFTFQFSSVYELSIQFLSHSRTCRSPSVASSLEESREGASRTSSRGSSASPGGGKHSSRSCSPSHSRPADEDRQEEQSLLDFV